MTGVVALVLVIVALGGHSPGNGPGPGVIAASTDSPVVSPSSSVVATSGATPIATHRASPAGTLRLPHAKHHRPAWRTATAPVRVYNTTHVTGLAHEVAGQLGARGWTIPEVGNYSALSAATTLYYSPSNRAAARHLAHEFSGITRIAPNSLGGIHYGGLTLLLTADWHG